MSDIYAAIEELTKDKHPLKYTVSRPFCSVEEWENKWVNSVLKNRDKSELMDIFIKNYHILTLMLNIHQLNLIRLLLVEYDCNASNEFSRTDLSNRLLISVDDVSRLVNSLKKYCYDCTFDGCYEVVAFLDVGCASVTYSENIYYFDLDFMWKTIAHLKKHYETEQYYFWKTTSVKERKEFQKSIRKHLRRQTTQKFTLHQPPELKINVPKNNCERPF